MIKYQKLPKNILQLLPKAADYLESHPKVLFAYLFGGLVRGNLQPLSDVDLAVYLTEHNISVITYMEILGHRFGDKGEEEFIQELLELFNIIYIDREIADKVIEIRKKERIKLPDAIIAAQH